MARGSVWDYAGGGIELMREFWTAAAQFDPAAAELTEEKRFAFCSKDGMFDFAKSAGLASLDVRAIERPSVFKDSGAPSPWAPARALRPWRWCAFHFGSTDDRP